MWTLGFRPQIRGATTIIRLAANTSTLHLQPHSPAFLNIRAVQVPTRQRSLSFLNARLPQMRLLHTETLTLHECTVENAPRYAILSHTWGENEFKFEDNKDMEKFRNNPTRGFLKIRDACIQARRDDLDYVWVDTCCIDKSSSAELSEAINSMFKWYRNSAICYAFLEDVTMENGIMTNFDTSKWFTRGWTLQELIAPHEVHFFDRRWKRMQSRWELSTRIAHITGIREQLLRRRHRDTEIPQSKLRGGLPCSECGYLDTLQRSLTDEPIAEKMKWAGSRVTTRKEDTAYCLMGLFDVNMPLLYGEGNKAFLRLQEEILENHPDQSILTSTETLSPLKGARRPKTYLPESPSAYLLDFFQGDESRLGRDDIIKTPRGLEIDVLLAPCEVTQYYHTQEPTKHKNNEWLAVLSCTIGADRLSRVAIFLKALHPESNTTGFIRVSNEYIVILEPNREPRVVGVPSAEPDVRTVSLKCSMEKFEQRKIMLQFVHSHAVLYEIPAIKISHTLDNGWYLQAQYPSCRGDLLEPAHKKFKDSKGLSIAIRVVFCFTNGESFFFVILAVDNTPANGRLASEARYTCWIERSNSPFGLGLESASVKEIGLGRLRIAQQMYIEYYSTRVFAKPSSRIVEDTYKANATVETTRFLGRVMHTLDVRISTS